MLGTRIGADVSLEGSVNGAGDGGEIVVREPLRVPWLVAGVRMAVVVYRGLALELGYTAALVRVSVDEPANGAPRFFPAAGPESFMLL